MDCVLTAENTLIMDKLMRFPKSEIIVFDTTSPLTIQLLSANMTSMLQIKLNSGFFNSFYPKAIQIATPFLKFYMPGMKELTIKQSLAKTALEYKFDGYTYTKVVDNINGKMMDMEFIPTVSFKLDLPCFKEISKYIKGRRAIISVGDVIRISCPGSCIEYKNTMEVKENIEFTIDTEILKGLLYHSNIHYDHEFVYSNESDCLNVVFRGPSILMLFFIAIE